MIAVFPLMSRSSLSYDRPSGWAVFRCALYAVSYDDTSPPSPLRKGNQHETPLKIKSRGRGGRAIKSQKINKRERGGLILCWASDRGVKDIEIIQLPSTSIRIHISTCPHHVQFPHDGGDPPGVALALDNRTVPPDPGPFPATN